MRRPSYANVASTLALILAMSGTAYATTLADNSVGTRHLKDDAVTNAEVANAAIGTAQLQSGAVTSGKIKAGAVTATRIAPDAVAGAHIAPDAVTAAEIAPDAVGTGEIAHDAVQQGEIAQDAVGASEIQGLSVDTPDIAVGAINSSRIADGSVEAGDLASSAKRVWGYQRLQSSEVTLPANSTNVGFGGGFQRATISCPAGSNAIGGGFYKNITDIEIAWSYATSQTEWQVMAWNPTNETNRKIVAHVICAFGG